MVGRAGAAVLGSAHAAASKLPVDGLVYHYEPIDFMQWLNDLTWSSEWPKYRVTGGNPAVPIPRPVTPRSRRV